MGGVLCLTPSWQAWGTLTASVKGRESSPGHSLAGGSSLAGQKCAKRCAVCAIAIHPPQQQDPRISPLPARMFTDYGVTVHAMTAKASSRQIPVGGSLLFRPLMVPSVLSVEKGEKCAQRPAQAGRPSLAAVCPRCTTSNLIEPLGVKATHGGLRLAGLGDQAFWTATRAAIFLFSFSAGPSNGGVFQRP
jgi:hypothetical protein